MKRRPRRNRRQSEEGEHGGRDGKPGSAGKCESKRNVRVAMIKSSLLADLPEVPFGRAKERGREMGRKTRRARVRLASFYAALCLPPLGSYLTDAPPFILSSIDSSLSLDCANLNVADGRFLDAPRNYETIWIEEQGKPTKGRRALGNCKRIKTMKQILKVKFLRRRVIRAIYRLLH